MTRERRPLTKHLIYYSFRSILSNAETQFHIMESLWKNNRTRILKANFQRLQCNRNKFGIPIVPANPEVDMKIKFFG